MEDEGPQLFDSIEGNILLGGLPRECGSEVVYDHFLGLERLGQSVERLFGRVLRELVEGLRDEERASQIAIRPFEDIWENREERVLKTRDFYFPVDGSLWQSEWVQKVVRSLSDLAPELTVELELVTPGWRDGQVNRLIAFMLGPPERGIREVLQSCPAPHLELFSAEPLLSPSWQGPLAEISAIHVALGLHELDRSPWAVSGGMCAGRGVDDQYLAALRGLNRHVVHSYVIGDWLWDLPGAPEQISSGLEELIALTIPFQPVEAVSDALTHLSRMYLREEPALTVVLARTALEAVLHRVYNARGMPKPEGLPPQIEWLVRTNLLTQHGRRCANEVRVRANKAIHEGLSGYQSRSVALDTIKSLFAVIMELRDDIEEPVDEPEPQ